MIMATKRKKKFLKKFLIAITVILMGSIIWEYGTGAPHQACACIPPDYLAHFTDEQALSFIQTRLEEAGLIFDDEAPPYTTDWYGGRRWGRDVGIDFFDSDRNIAITFINMHDDATSSVNEDYGSEHWRANRIADEFTENFDGIHFGVFYNPSVWRPWDMQRRWFAPSPHTESEVLRLTERIEVQINYFIDQLREESIID